MLATTVLHVSVGTSAFDKAAALAEVSIALLTLVGILVSLRLSREALRQVEADRAARQSPFLVFERGGYRNSVEFVKAGPSVPGFNPKFAASMFPGLRPTDESVRLSWPAPHQPPFYGDLRNLGSGAAVGVAVTWIPAIVSIGPESFRLDDAKLAEPRYAAALNTMPVSPTHLEPTSGAAHLPRLPTFIDKDIDKRITRVEGTLQITCQDIAANDHAFRQRFILMTGYDQTPPWVHVTFGDLVRPPAEPAAESLLVATAREVASAVLRETWPFA